MKFYPLALLILFPSEVWPQEAANCLEHGAEGNTSQEHPSPVQRRQRVSRWEKTIHDLFWIMPTFTVSNSKPPISRPLVKVPSFLGIQQTALNGDLHAFAREFSRQKTARDMGQVGPQEYGRRLARLADGTSGGPSSENLLFRLVLPQVRELSQSLRSPKGTLDEGAYHRPIRDAQKRLRRAHVRLSGHTLGSPLPSISLSNVYTRTAGPGHRADVI